MFWVYILRCSDDSYYTGHTDNLENRIGQHMLGASDAYTASRLPIQLVWSQEFATRAEALEAELRVKRWNRKKKEALMLSDWEQLSQAAKKSFKRKNP